MADDDDENEEEEEEEGILDGAFADVTMRLG